MNPSCPACFLKGRHTLINKLTSGTFGKDNKCHFIYLKFQIVESDKIEEQSMTAAASMSYSPYINPQAVTMFNMSSLLNQKDSRWLQLEVCRESQRQKCTRSDAECKFAHPPPNVEVQNGRVTACYDSIKVGKFDKETRHQAGPEYYKIFLQKYFTAL